MAVLQGQLRDGLCRAGKTQPTGVERHVVEARVVNLRVEVAPHVAAPRMVLLPDQLGRFGSTKPARRVGNSLALCNYAIIQ